MTERDGFSLSGSLQKRYVIYCLFSIIKNIVGGRGGVDSYKRKKEQLQIKKGIPKTFTSKIKFKLRKKIKIIFKGLFPALIGKSLHQSINLPQLVSRTESRELSKQYLHLLMQCALVLVRNTVSLYK